MSVSGLIVGLIILAVTVIWIAAPLLRRGKNVDTALGAKQRERLLMVYERVLTNIRDLEEDHRTGKMNTGDFESERETWVGRGVQVLKALDQLDAQGTLSLTPDAAATERSIDDEIEAAIAKYRLNPRSSGQTD